MQNRFRIPLPHLFWKQTHNWQENSSVWPYKTLLQEYYIQIALYWIIWYWSLNYTYGIVEEITLPVITAFSSKVKIKYETEKYICVKTNKMDKFNKKWALPLDSVPQCCLYLERIFLFCIVTLLLKFIV